MADNTAAGESIRTLRQLASMTLEDVARDVPTSTSYLSKVETGKANPTRFWVAAVVAVIADNLSAKKRNTSTTAA